MRYGKYKAHFNITRVRFGKRGPRPARHGVLWIIERFEASCLCWRPTPDPRPGGPLRKAHLCFLHKGAVVIDENVAAAATKIGRTTFAVTHRAARCEWTVADDPKGWPCCDD